MGVRLDSWKAIAAHLGREVRTVQRWETERGLPVHRLPGGEKPRVYALEAELDAWLGRPPAQPDAPLPSVAVLPFVNLSSDPENEYFGDGLADEIITALARVPGLRVAARTSSFAFRDKQGDAREIGARLGADALLEGSVRREDRHIRVLVQLIGTRDGCHLWSEGYDREFHQIFAIQDEIASSVTHALRVRLVREPPAHHPTTDPEAYASWLKGRYLAAQWTERAMAEAVECHRAALARDVRFPMPYVSLAEMLFEGAWFGLVNPKEACRDGRELVRKALDLDDGLSDAYSVLGALLGMDYDWAGAERAFDRALELSPDSVAVLYRHAWCFLAPRMRLAQAVEELCQAIGQDPLSPLLRAALGLVLVEARQYERAEAECRMAVELAPALWWPRLFLGRTMILQPGKADEGLAHVRRACDELRAPALSTAFLCLTYGLLGRRQEAVVLLEQLEEMNRAAPLPPCVLAWAYLGVGEERAFEWLDRAIDARDPITTHLMGMPDCDGVRDDPRFAALLAKAGLGQPV